MKLKLWSMMMLAAMTMSVATSCGDDDGGDVGNRPVNPVNPDNPDPNAFISFKDNKVAMICIANFDLNKDNQLSYGEAATVRSLNGVFAGKDITLFDELKYFTGLSEISDEAFRNCSSLTSVTIPNSVTSIGWYAFCNCRELASVTIPNSVTSIGFFAFTDCSSLTSITIPNSVTSIGGDAFRGCSGLTSITIPNSVTSIGGGAFNGCSGLTSIVVESGNSKYDSRNNCNAIIETSSNKLIVGCKYTFIPTSVTSIEPHTFDGCSGLTSVTIPNSVKSIGQSAFQNCPGLTSVTIPNSVTSIGWNAFFGCSSLTSLVSQIVNPFSVSDILGYTSMYEKVTLYVPKGTIDKYKTTPGWSEFKNIVEQ